MGFKVIIMGWNSISSEKIPALSVCKIGDGLIWPRKC